MKRPKFFYFSTNNSVVVGLPRSNIGRNTRVLTIVYYFYYYYFVGFMWRDQERPYKANLFFFECLVLFDGFFLIFVQARAAGSEKKINKQEL